MTKPDQRAGCGKANHGNSQRPQQAYLSFTDKKLYDDVEQRIKSDHDKRKGGAGRDSLGACFKQTDSPEKG